MKRKYHHYSGIIHVHSTYSDGERDVGDIMSIANELDIDFLLLTDHNTLQPKFDGLEGWYDKVLLGIGCELNDHLDRNHYLAFNIDQEIDPELPPEEYTCKVRDAGGFGIIAHPNENRTRMRKYPPYPWTKWETPCYDGIEIWNQMSEWMEGLTHMNKYYRFMHPRKSIIAPKKETCQIWDEINKTRKVVGIGGVDAHGHIHRLWGMFRVRVFRYKVSFKTIRTHLLTKEKMRQTDDFKQDIDLIYQAIKNANCFISHYYFGDASDFLCWIENKDEEAIIGEQLKLDDQTFLYVKNPELAKTILIHDGEMVAQSTGTDVRFKIDKPGIYRTESHIDNRPWILTNHIRVTV